MRKLQLYALWVIPLLSALPAPAEAGVTDVLCWASADQFWWFCPVGGGDDSAGGTAGEGVAGGGKGGKLGGGKGGGGADSAKAVGRDDNSTSVKTGDIQAERVQVGDSKEVAGDDESHNIATGDIEADTVDMSKTGDVGRDNIKADNVTIDNGNGVTDANVENGYLRLSLKDGQVVTAYLLDASTVSTIKEMTSSGVDFKALSRLESLDVSALQAVSKIDVTKIEAFSKVSSEPLKGEPGEAGRQGRPGVDGRDGKDGKDGENGIAGKDGLDGKDGAPGLDGKDGAPGLSVDTSVFALKTELPDTSRFVSADALEPLASDAELARVAERLGAVESAVGGLVGHRHFSDEILHEPWTVKDALESLEYRTVGKSVVVDAAFVGDAVGVTFYPGATTSPPVDGVYDITFGPISYSRVSGGTLFLILQKNGVAQIGGSQSWALQASGVLAPKTFSNVSLLATDTVDVYLSNAVTGLNLAAGWQIKYVKKD